jgi:large subunit ribosomal protein L24
MSKIIKGDTVMVVAGVDKGKRGKVIKVVNFITSYGLLRRAVVVSGINIKYFNKKDVTGTVRSSKEYPVDVSNVMYWDEQSGTKERVGFMTSAGKKVRYCKYSRNIIG